MNKTYNYTIAGDPVEITEEERAEILRGKRTFMLYTDKLALMDDILETLEEKGLLLEAIYRAQTGQELPDLSGNKRVAAIFKQLSNNWNIDDDKYIKTTLKNRINLSKRKSASGNKQTGDTEHKYTSPKIYSDENITVSCPDEEDDEELPFD